MIIQTARVQEFQLLLKCFRLRNQKYIQYYSFFHGVAFEVERILLKNLKHEDFSLLFFCIIFVKSSYRSLNDIIIILLYF